ncbi:hypothetical protein [Streptomyces sp. PU_AKi4]|uniref:hypothetical protein n=1 Tax=Streptomyces sp. PU_AKi4 TaxID=2800809 RepID=UPI003524A83F
MHNPDECFAVGLKLPELDFVAFSKLFEFDDPLPQSHLAVRYLTACRDRHTRRCGQHLGPGRAS